MLGTVGASRIHLLLGGESFSLVSAFVVSNCPGTALLQVRRVVYTCARVLPVILWCNHAFGSREARSGVREL